MACDYFKLFEECKNAPLLRPLKMPCPPPVEAWTHSPCLVHKQSQMQHATKLAKLGEPTSVSKRTTTAQCLILLTDLVIEQLLKGFA